MHDGERVGRRMEGCDNGNRPKQCRARHLGHVVSFLKILSDFINTNYVLLYIQVIYYNYMTGKGTKDGDNKNGDKRCQMCCLCLQ